MKWPSETLPNLPNFGNTKTHVVCSFFIFHVNIHQKGKDKIAVHLRGSTKSKKGKKLCFCIPKILHKTGSFHQALNFYF